MTTFEHPLDLLEASDVFDHKGDAAVLAVARGEENFIIQETAAQRLEQFGWKQEPLPDPPFYIAPRRLLDRVSGDTETLINQMMHWKLADHCRLFLQARNEGIL